VRGEYGVIEIETVKEEKEEKEEVAFKNAAYTRSTGHSRETKVNECNRKRVKQISE
jgi:hypothetical protein